MSVHYSDASVTVHAGDCLDVLRTLPDASVDAVCTDPPYGLEFMGKEWDAPWKQGADVHAKARDLRAGEMGDENKRRFIASAVNTYSAGAPFQAWCQLWATECLRVLKPGGHMLAFGGTRTSHRLACAIEDAGFEIRDSIAWLYGSGFSKSWNFKTMYQGAWCECEGGKALPLGHAGNADLSRVRDHVHSSAIARGEGEDAVLLTPLQRRGEGARVGEARSQGPGSLVAGSRSIGASEDDRGEQPGMGGRDVPRAGEGLPDGAPAGSPEGEGKRLRGRAPTGDGVADRAASEATRGGASHQRGPSGQPTGELETLPGSHEPLDDRALRDSPVCSRCGGLDPFYRGAGTGLKPAHEPIVVARKPLSGTVAANVLAHGTGALNVDGCRVGTTVETWPASRSFASGISPGYTDGIAKGATQATGAAPAGRWPANVVLDESQAEALDEMSGERPGDNPNRAPRNNTAEAHNRTASMGGTSADWTTTGHADSGGASRFFYVAKADASERVRVNGTAHPTVKPLALMRWLVRLVTPPGGTVLEPFAGSGTTVEACILEGFHCVAIEREADYLPLITQRINRRRNPVEAVKTSGEDGGLFDLLEPDEPSMPPPGRWPTNVVLDRAAAAEIDEQSGELRARGNTAPTVGGGGMYGHAETTVDHGSGDAGGASRFFPVFDEDGGAA